MKKLFIWVARLAAIAGVGLMAVAVAARLGGAFFLAGFQVGTLLQAGIALALVGCLAYVAALVERPPA